ncbi:MAG: hypothetical protein ACYDAA_12225 [Syntrophales bacterium]
MHTATSMKISMSCDPALQMAPFFADEKKVSSPLFTAGFPIPSGAASPLPLGGEEGTYAIPYYRAGSQEGGAVLRSALRTVSPVLRTSDGVQPGKAAVREGRKMLQLVVINQGRHDWWKD